MLCFQLKIDIEHMVPLPLVRMSECEMNESRQTVCASICIDNAGFFLFPIFPCCYLKSQIQQHNANFTISFGENATEKPNEIEKCN